MSQPANLKIYTKTGDKGLTRLVDGRECSKASLRVESYGTVDELNSQLGMVLMALRKTSPSPLQSLAHQIEVLQNQLFNLGSHLACEKEETRKMLPDFDESWIGSLETAIDQMTEELPPLKDFILPGGCESSSLLHVCRTVCRRAERLVVQVLEENSAPSSSEVDLRALRYLNRLSDYLFVASRYCNQLSGISDQVWKKQMNKLGPI